MEKIISNLDDTMGIVRGSLVKLSERGAQLNVLEDASQRLLDSSDAFVARVVPWYRRLRCPCAWWFRGWFTMASRIEEGEFIIKKPWKVI